MANISPFQPPAESQFQPVIPTSRVNCVPCTTRKLIRRATCDAKAPSTASVRAASGAPSTRGLTYGEAATAAAKWGVKLIPSYGNSRDETWSLVDAGHATGGSIDCSVTVHTERATGGYTGDHTVYIQDCRSVPVGGTCLCELHSAAQAHNELQIEDPGNSSKGYQWWSADLFYRAAEARTVDHLGISHGINLLVAPDTEGVTRIGIGGLLYDSPYRSSPVKGKVVAGKAYTITSTFNGGGWPRSDGTTANGWHRLPGDLYTPGKGMK